ADEIGDGPQRRRSVTRRLGERPLDGAGVEEVRLDQVESLTFGDSFELRRVDPGHCDAPAGVEEGGDDSAAETTGAACHEDRLARHCNRARYPPVRELDRIKRFLRNVDEGASTSVRQFAAGLGYFNSHLPNVYDRNFLLVTADADRAAVARAAEDLQGGAGLAHPKGGVEHQREAQRVPPPP